MKVELITGDKIVFLQMPDTGTENTAALLRDLKASMTNKYKITTDKDIKEEYAMVIEAPCFGLAVDMCLASRGMFGYNDLTVEASEATPDIDLFELAHYYPNWSDVEEQKKFNEHHKTAILKGVEY